MIPCLALEPRDRRALTGCPSHVHAMQVLRVWARLKQGGPEGTAMRRLMVLMFVLSALGPAPRAHAEQNLGSANYMLPLCKSWLKVVRPRFNSVDEAGLTFAARPRGVPKQYYQTPMRGWLQAPCTERCAGCCCSRSRASPAAADRV